jgi:hypothetical protein
MEHTRYGDRTRRKSKEFRRIRPISIVMDKEKAPGLGSMERENDVQEYIGYLQGRRREGKGALETSTEHRYQESDRH